MPPGCAGIGLIVKFFTAITFAQPPVAVKVKTIVPFSVGPAV